MLLLCEIMIIIRTSANRLRWKWLVKEERFEFKVKLMRGEGKKRAESVSVTKDWCGEREDWWSCWGRVFQVQKRYEETIKDPSVNLIWGRWRVTMSDERTGGRWRVTMSDERVRWLDWTLRRMCRPVTYRYEGFPDWRVTQVIDRTLYWIRCSIVSQWIDWRTGVMWENLGV